MTKMLLPEEIGIHCMHCAFCLNHCPTYKVMVSESYSPRGRMLLLMEAARGTFDLEEIAPYMQSCVGCRACEANCTLGVKYGNILKLFNQNMKNETTRPRFQEFIEKISLRYILPHGNRLRFLAFFFWLYQAIGMQSLLRKSGLLRKTSALLADMDLMLPTLANPFQSLRQSNIEISSPVATVALFKGCIQDAFCTKTNISTAEILQAMGFKVVIPAGQTCCGAISDHLGDEEGVRSLAQKNITAFNDENIDFIIVNAGGCGAMLKEYPELFPVNSYWNIKARAFSEKVKDVYEFLDLYSAKLQELLTGELTNTVTYQDSCHLANVQGIKEQPRNLISMIPGVNYVELEDAHICCGSGGSYVLRQHELSMQVLDEKMSKIKETGASVVATANPGCYFQLLLGTRRHGLEKQIKVVQLMDLLHESFNNRLNKRSSSE